PLTPEEQEAYAKIDSSDTIEKAFKPSGFFSRFIDFDDDTEKDSARTRSSGDSSFNMKIPGHFEPRLRFNRVQGLYAGLKYHITPLGNLKLMAEGGYETAGKVWNYGGGLQYSFYRLPLKPVIGVLYRLNTVPRYQSLIYNPTITSAVSIFGYENYFDYFKNEGMKFYLRLNEPKSNLALNIAFTNKKQSSRAMQTEYDILGRDNNLRINPEINEGRLNALSFGLSYNGSESYTFGLTGSKQASLGIEISNDKLGSDFNYVRFTGNISWSFQTLFQRRLFPNVL